MGNELPWTSLATYVQPSLRSVAVAGVMLVPGPEFNLGIPGPQAGCLAYTEVGPGGRIVVRWPGRTS